MVIAREIGPPQAAACLARKVGAVRAVRRTAGRGGLLALTSRTRSEYPIDAFDCQWSRACRSPRCPRRRNSVWRFSVVICVQLWDWVIQLSAFTTSRGGELLSFAITMPLRSFLRELYKYPRLTGQDRNSAVSYFKDFPAVRSDTILDPESGIWHDPLPFDPFVLCFKFPQFKVEDTYYTYALAYAPVVFELTARISTRDCFLTTEGDKSAFLPDNSGKPTASCWLRRPAGNRGRDEWVRMMQRLEHLADEFSVGETDKSALFSGRPSGQPPTGPMSREGWLHMRLQVGISLRANAQVRRVDFLVWSWS